MTDLADTSLNLIGNHNAGSALALCSTTMPAAFLLSLFLLAACSGVAQTGQQTKGSWVDALLAARAELAAAKLPETARAAKARQAWEEIENAFPVQCDWVRQDSGTNLTKWLSGSADRQFGHQLLEHALSEPGWNEPGLTREVQSLRSAPEDRLAERWLSLYVQICEQRRSLRLKTLRERAPRFVFTKHPTIRPSFFAYTEGQSDAQAERHFHPGSSLCQFELDGLYGKVTTLLEDPTGAIRDPAVSYDGQRVLFAWKKSLNEDDYHLYELELASGKIRQITSGLGFADYEPAYLPNGDLIFSSTRCVQTVDCWWTEVSNLYTCDADGRFLRRLGVDQVHTVFPTVMEDGRVIYTRWDYNDRGQVFPQALFQMNLDGTGQTEFYGNNSWFPTTIAHARNIPGTQKVIATLCGHHSPQTGKLAIIDPALGRQENSGVQLIAPVRATEAERIDSYGQEGELFQYPYPLNEREFIVTFSPLGWKNGDRRRGTTQFSIYYLAADGRRELLVTDSKVDCQQAVPLIPRPVPASRPSTVDYRKSNGYFYLQDVYTGPGLAGIPRGSVKRLRVVALDFRAAGIGSNGSRGPGGGALISTPVAVGNGTWDVKMLLGDATVHADGSAAFEVPARTPVYFQALDEKGHALQTMRSWSTLQPGEIASCVGCHEHKNAAPPVQGMTLAQQQGPEPLTPFYGPARGFSFTKEIQPILDRKCVACHHESQTLMTGAGWRGADSAYRQRGDTGTNAFSLLGKTIPDPRAKRNWSESYLNLTQSSGDREEWAVGSFRGDNEGRIVKWISSQSEVSQLPPRFAGANRSELITLLERGHYGLTMSREEMDKLACWIDLLVPFCGDYYEAAAWTPTEREKYDRFQEKRRRMENLEQQNIADLLAHRR